MKKSQGGKRRWLLSARRSPRKINMAWILFSWLMVLMTSAAFALKSGNRIDSMLCLNALVGLVLFGTPFFLCMISKERYMKLLNYVSRRAVPVLAFNLIAANIFLTGILIAPHYHESPQDAVLEAANGNEDIRYNILTDVSILLLGYGQEKRQQLESIKTRWKRPLDGSYETIIKPVSYVLGVNQASCEYWQQTSKQ